MSVKRKYDFSSDETKRQCVDEIVTRLEDSENPGVLAAQDIIDIVTQKLGSDIYRKAVEDVNNLLQTKMQDLQIEIDLLT